MTHNRFTPFSAFQYTNLNEHGFRESLRAVYDYIQRLSTVKAITFGDTPYTFDRGDFLVRADCTNGDITLNLPPSDDWVGDWIIIKRTDSSANTLTITPDGTDVIDGETSLTLDFQYEVIQLYCAEEGVWDIISLQGSTV